MNANNTTHGQRLEAWLAVKRFGSILAAHICNKDGLSFLGDEVQVDDTVQLVESYDSSTHIRTETAESVAFHHFLEILGLFRCQPPHRAYFSRKSPFPRRLVKTTIVREVNPPLGAFCG